MHTVGVYWSYTQGKGKGTKDEAFIADYEMVLFLIVFSECRGKKLASRTLRVSRGHFLSRHA